MILKLGDYGSAHYIDEEATTALTGARGNKERFPYYLASCVVIKTSH